MVSTVLNDYKIMQNTNNTYIDNSIRFEVIIK